MKIVKLKAENIKKLVAVEIEPTGSIVKITGKNASGKTSVLDSIFWALGGSQGIQDQPIRKGQTKAQVEIDLGEMVVKRTFNDGGTTALTIENKDGLRFKSPQTLLDGLMGRLSFDPLEFMREDPRRQFDTLKTLTGVDFSKLDGMRQKAYDERTAVNREVNKLKVTVESTVVPAMPAEPDETEIDVSDMANQLTRAVTLQNDKKVLDREIRDTEAGIVDLAERMTDLKEQITVWQKDLLALEKECEDRKATVLQRREEAAALIIPDISALQSKLLTAEDTNKAIRALRFAYEKKKAEVDTASKLKSVVQKDLAVAEKESLDLTTKIETIDQEKQDMLAKANFPLAELSFGDGLVTYNGLPLNQSSSAEQLQVSMAMAMALNPKLKVLRITDGSLLDSEHMKTIEELATAKDYQLWIEICSDDNKVGVVIEEGQILVNNYEKEKSAEQAKGS